MNNGKDNYSDNLKEDSKFLERESRSTVAIGDITEEEKNDEKILNFII